MPLIILGLILVAVLLIPMTAQAYVNGKPVTINVTGIGDFNCVLRSDAATMWMDMKVDALLDGVTLKPKGPNSAFRTHEQQAEMIEERPTFAAALDHSPHQGGFAIDVDLTEPGALEWLQENAVGYNWFPLSGAGATKEPWHWEYHNA